MDRIFVLLKLISTHALAILHLDDKRHQVSIECRTSLNAIVFISSVSCRAV